MRRSLSVLLIPLFLASCGRGHDHPHPHEEEEEKTAQITVWGERFEIFLEHRLIVAGSPVRFITHVSDLQTLEPRRKDPVTFVLKPREGATIEHVEPAPQRPGIYIPELTFPKPGGWTVTLRIPIDGGESVVELPEMIAYASAEDAKHAKVPEAPEGISFLKEQQWRILTATDAVRKRTLRQRARVAATVSAVPGSQAAVSAPIAGRLLVADAKGFPRLGDRVEAGQVLARVQSPFSDLAARIVEAGAEVARTRLAAEQAGLAHGRMKKLAEANARTARELEEAEFALKSAQAAHRAAVALQEVYEKAGTLLSEQGTPVLELKSPISGVVTGISGTVGEFVPSDRTIFRVLDASTVLVTARIPEADLATLGSSRAALVESPDRPGEYRPLATTARAPFFSPELDPVTRTASLTFEVPNSEGRLLVSATLTLHLETAKAEETPAVPSTAIVDEDGQPVAFVMVSGETFEKRPLKLGIRDGGWVQVLDGLAEGERVVTKEAFAIRLASVSSVIPAHGHAH